MEGGTPPCHARNQELASLLMPEGSCERDIEFTPGLRGGMGTPGPGPRSSSSKLSGHRPDRLRVGRRSSTGPWDSLPSPVMGATYSPTRSSCSFQTESLAEDLRGGEGVRVMVRVRPLNRRERDVDLETPGPSLAVQGTTTVVLSDPCRNEPLTKSYDHVFGPDCGQEDVFAVAGLPMVEHCLAGFNSSLFAYGQTGAGKTHTMLGGACASDPGDLHADCGLAPRIFVELFRRMREAERQTANSDASVESEALAGDKAWPETPVVSGAAPRTAASPISSGLATGREQGEEEDAMVSGPAASMLLPQVGNGLGPGTQLQFEASCSFLEIYNEEVTDLLVPGPPLQVRDGDPQRGVYVQDLSTHTVSCAQAVLTLLQRGGDNRRVTATRMNDRSSRSHSVFTCCVTAVATAATGLVTRRTSKLSLVDLAGSERVGRSGARGEALVEARSINRSLAGLARVISALAERSRRPGAHVPFRDSRLTFLLQESLGGNARTAIVACVTPAPDSAAETVSTLLFASGAKKVRCRPVANEDSSGDLRALQQENSRLNRLVAALQAALASGSAPDVLTASAVAGETSLVTMSAHTSGSCAQDEEKVDNGDAVPSPAPPQTLLGGGGGDECASPTRAQTIASGLCIAIGRGALSSSAATTDTCTTGRPALLSALPSPAVQALDGELARLRAAGAESGREVAKVRAALEAELARNAALETVFDQNNAAIAGLRGEAESLRRRADEATNEAAAARGELDAAREQAAELAADVAALRVALDEAQAVSVAAREEARDAGRRAATSALQAARAIAAEERLAAAETDIELLKQELAVSEQRQRTAEAAAAAAVDDAARARRGAEEDAGLAAARCGRLVREAEDLHQTNQALRRDGERLRDELSVQTVTVAKYRRMVAEISRLIDWAQGGLGIKRSPGTTASETSKPGITADSRALSRTHKAGLLAAAGRMGMPLADVENLPLVVAATMPGAAIAVKTAE